ncbi:cyclin-dependent kinase 7 [Nematocida sp. AWRm80]|nr:cyclin-dependent kinase 7 [Nematocida sp. AWRm80]
MERVKRYTRGEKVGEGTYARIYEGYEYSVSAPDAAKEIITETPPVNGIRGRKVAIKRIKIVKERASIEVSALREIKHLKRVSSPNVIDILDVFEQGGQIHIVLPFLETNLEIIIRNKNLVFMLQDVKAWMLMICNAIHACHSEYILHRDIKPNNILIGKGGAVKLADFGLAADFGFPIRNMTNEVITRWYKSPELLLGATNYTFGADIWALGCLFAELLLRLPYLPGNDDIQQLELIFKAHGTPTKEEWPEIKELPGYRLNFQKVPKRDISTLFSAAGSEAIDLLQKMFVYNPSKRITIEDILAHPYFTASPSPTSPEHLPFEPSAV